MIPVALFAYARPHYLERTLACLQANRVPLVYAYSDGPKAAAMGNRVRDVRAILHAVDWCEISIVERDENLGLGRSIRAGVADVLTRHDSLLVFEDDLVCVDGTYAYLSAALDAYANDPRVMSVTGWTHPQLTPPDVTDQPYFDGRAECWVWGTWRRAWRGMDQEALTLVAECERRGIDPYRYGADLIGMARDECEKNIWAVRFLYLHLVNGGLCLRPPHSMVEHIGRDADATNAPDPTAWTNPPLAECPPIPGRWPEPIEHPACQALAQRAFGAKPLPPSAADRLGTVLRHTIGRVRARLGRLEHRDRSRVD